ncbi:hypothetical protein [Polyangium sp. 6x1]|uniref:hypothetical protein n=1 Tax=Polyangium sp. 6x1 TaxID=3042689 RepID=UPI002482836A|nr:hypothetical protein [Polyangium sp. 6x1]MDI1443716.1 hypothetical protein [Polyangium sp. 6x1]
MSESKEDPTDAADKDADRPEERPAAATETEAGPAAEADAEAEAKGKRVGDARTFHRASPGGEELRGRMHCESEHAPS